LLLLALALALASANTIRPPAPAGAPVLPPAVVVGDEALDVDAEADVGGGEAVGAARALPSGTTTRLPAPPPSLPLRGITVRWRAAGTPSLEDAGDATTRRGSTRTGCCC